jgi:phage tail-like protein
MTTGVRIDPYSSFLFRVEIDGITQGHFRECTGLSSSVEVIENPEGGNGHVGKMPGRVKYPNIVLKWGLTDDTDLYEWHRTVLQGTIQRKNGSIIQLDSTGNEKARWNFVDGWPTKWDGPTFNAGATELSIETLEIAHEGVERG